MKLKSITFIILVLCIANISTVFGASRLTLMGAGGGSGVAYVGPGDIVSGARGWWGLRGYNGAFSGPVANVCDSATGLICADITWSAGALSFPTIGGSLCNNSTNICVVKTLYDQSGNAKNLTQATNANRPTLFVNGLGTLPYIVFTSTQSFTQRSITSTPTPWTISMVLERTTSTAIDAFSDSSAGATSLGWSDASANISIFAGFSTFSASATDSVFHAVQGIANSAGTTNTLYIDGVSSSGAVGGSNTIAGVSMNNGNAFGTGAFNFTEMGVWPSAFSAGNQSLMNSNQHTYWGF